MKMMEEGLYYGIVTGQSVEEAKTGNVQFVLNVEIIQRARGGHSNPTGPWDMLDQPEIAVVRTTLTENTVERFRKELKVLGYEGDDLSVIHPEHPQAVDFTGREVPVFCKREEWKGKPRMKWSINSFEPAKKASFQTVQHLMSYLSGRDLNVLEFETTSAGDIGTVEEDIPF